MACSENTLGAFCPTVIVDKRFCVNSYVITASEHAFVIDPVLNPELKKTLDGRMIDFALFSHEHYDHICCVNELRSEYGFPIVCSEKAKGGFADPAVNLSRYVEYLKRYIPFGTGEANPCDYTCRADRFLKDGETIDWQGHKLFIKETPGHSKGSICILLDDRHLFSGDTVFKDYPTATRLPGGSTKAYETITGPWLDALPQDTMVYPGHTEPFRLHERYKASH